MPKQEVKRKSDFQEGFFFGEFSVFRYLEGHFREQRFFWEGIWRF